MLHLPLCLILTPFAAAQDFPARIQEPAQKKATQAEVIRAVDETRKREVAAGDAEVAYEQILANPDDIDLNYRYARGQVRKGDLKRALATLERILMIDPKHQRARLFYGIVLLEAGNLDAAAAEFRILEGGTLPDELRTQLDAYLRRLDERGRKTRFTFLVGAGADFDDNRNAAPASGRRLFQDIPVMLDSGSTRKTDVGKIMIANLGVVRDLSAAGHQFFGNVGYYRAEQTNLKILNLQNCSATAGGLYRSAWADLVPSFEFNHLLLAQTTYLRAYHWKLRFVRRITDSFDAFAEGAYAWQQFSRTAVVPLGDQRTGNKFTGGAGGDWLLTPGNKLSFSYFYVDQGAAQPFDAYGRHSVTLADTAILPRGQFILASVSGNFDRYREPERPVSVADRNDELYRAQATYGLPLGILSKSLGDAVWNLTYEYYHAFSSIKNYSYSDNRVSTLFTYKWTFGF